MTMTNLYHSCLLLCYTLASQRLNINLFRLSAAMK